MTSLRLFTPMMVCCTSCRCNSLGEYKKHSKCSKGKHIDAWFMQQENRDRAKLPAIPEDQMEKAIEVIMDCLMENKLMHTAKKPDNARRIIKENNLVWDKKYVYSWDYDGPAVGLRKECDL